MIPVTNKVPSKLGSCVDFEVLEPPFVGELRFQLQESRAELQELKHGRDVALQTLKTEHNNELWELKQQFAEQERQLLHNQHELAEQVTALRNLLDAALVQLTSVRRLYDVEPMR